MSKAKQLEMKEKIEVYTAKQFAKWDLDKKGWRLKFSTSKRAAGNCIYGPKIIKISLPLAMARGINKTKNTVKHEIAHALVSYKHGHSYVWQAMAVKVGAKPERCFNMTQEEESKVEYKYTGTCTSCGNKTGYSRKLKRQHACAVCCNKFNYGRFSSEYVLVLKQNY